MIKLIPFSTLGDKRGSLISLEENYNVPFDIKRVYYIYATKAAVRRGYHAHKNLRQLAICVTGSCKFMLDDGDKRKDIELSSPAEGLLIEGLIWREMYDFSEDCVLMVLADNYYDENDYIRDYQEFKQQVNI